MRRRGFAALAALVAGFLLAPSTAGAAVPPVTRPATQPVADGLSRATPTTGTVWLVDPRSHRVVVEADRTVTGAGLARLAAAVRPYGGVVRRIPGTLGPRLSGGDPVLAGSFRCTVGVNVTAAGVYYFVSAGHCAQAASTWYTLGGALVGTTTAVRYPQDDYALVRYTGRVSHEGAIGKQDVTSAGTAHVGEHVCMRGGTSGVHCGTVLALNATVNYADGTVSGLIKTSICSEPGDSGAPLYDGTTVLGTLSGGSGNCTSGGVTYFQPILEVLSAYGVSVY